MRNRPSRTAEAVCLCRALEQARPPSRRVLDDPLAELFLPPQRRLVVRAARAAPRVARGLERVLDPGVVIYVLARHRTFDDWLLQALSEGVEQVLVLGAGYDTRAWRFAKQLAGRPVFEVDHPATSRRKRQLLARHRDRLVGFAQAGGASPPDLRQVPVDFQRESLRERLLDAGFEPDRPTFTIWEGVTMYLDEAALSSTLRVLGDLCGPGSGIGVDLWHGVPPAGFRGAVVRASAPIFGMIGEPLRFTMDPADAPAFFEQRGWTLTDRLDADDLTDRHGGDGRRVLPALYVVGLTGPAGSGGSGNT